MTEAGEILKRLEGIEVKLDIANGCRPEVLDLNALSKILCVSRRKLEELIDHPTNPLRPHLFKVDGIGKWLVERDEALTWFRRFRISTNLEDTSRACTRLFSTKGHLQAGRAGLVSPAYGGKRP